VATFGTRENVLIQVRDFLESKIRNEFVKHTLADGQSKREAISENVIAAARPELEQRFMHRLHDMVDIKEV
jgi:hypothetical protein